MAGRWPLPAILWIHGGAYILGTPETASEAAVRFEWGLLPTYRLAPDHPAPAALDDCVSVLQWLASGAEGLVDPKGLLWAGMAAGWQPPWPSLVYPMLGDRTNLPGAVLLTHPGMWTLETNKYAWKSYLVPHADSPEGAPKYAVPARREYLAGLAETWIGVGIQDLFYAEDKEYARRLRSAGVRMDRVHAPQGRIHEEDSGFT
ncbi:alpha/beta-hydrolase [Gonapodya prolifera JEL478]|uniref:Alpha/beta-hydrolase n=1 Tax=Gonapodya prolifera (strain JEL478) TaxID=1344416 RepID=A0A139AAR2_GONPJ|nr:alpha/beta-hydrolase [Gonapodya prolifera JEL478]|eukprot:KXS13896.1 alpha/beta-hydrolase [Gonapodya prolifera JEL478]